MLSIYVEKCGIYTVEGGVSRFISKFVMLKIMRRYGCWIAPDVTCATGFRIQHPVGIVIGGGKIGENFTIYQNCTIGTAHNCLEIPEIGNNVTLYAGSSILGNIKIVSNVSIGANSLAIRSIEESGTYAGNPCKKIR